MTGSITFDITVFQVVKELGIFATPYIRLARRKYYKYYCEVKTISHFSHVRSEDVCDYIIAAKFKIIICDL